MQSLSWCIQEMNKKKAIEDIEDEETGNRKCSKRTLSMLLAVALRMYLTLHLLLFGQSM